MQPEYTNISLTHRRSLFYLCKRLVRILLSTSSVILIVSIIVVVVVVVVVGVAERTTTHYHIIIENMNLVLVFHTSNHVFAMGIRQRPMVLPLHKMCAQFYMIGEHIQVTLHSSVSKYEFLFYFSLSFLCKYHNLCTHNNTLKLAVLACDCR